MATLNPARSTAATSQGDKVAAHELFLFIVDDADLYRQQGEPIILNLRRKIKRGIYDPQKALKLWRHLADFGAKKYTFANDVYLKTTGQYQHHAPHWKQLKGYGIFTVPIRELTARELAEHYDENIRGEGWKENPPSKIRKGVAYFPTFETARAFGAKVGRVVQYETGWAVQVRPGGDYFGPDGQPSIKKNPIKGPGKFEGELHVTRYAHENYDEDIGDVQELGWYGRFSGPIKGRGPFHIIVRENDQGFVYGKLYDSEQQINADWGEIVKEYEKLYEERGDE